MTSVARWPAWPIRAGCVASARRTMARRSRFSRRGGCAPSGGESSTIGWRPRTGREGRWRSRRGRAAPPAPPATPPARRLPGPRRRGTPCRMMSTGEARSFPLPSSFVPLPSAQEPPSTDQNDVCNMIRSMTGYGSAEMLTPARRFTVEMRSVNHRFSEILVRLPRDLSALEDRVRALVQSRVLRGRVEVTIMREERGARPKTVRSDPDLARAYAQALREAADVLGVAGEIGLSHIVSLPDVVKVEEAREDVEVLWPDLSRAVEEAVIALVGMREAEGRRLAAELLMRLDNVEGLTPGPEVRPPVAAAEYAQRLRQRVAELLREGPVDEARLATEILIFGVRGDVRHAVPPRASHP